MLRYRPDAAASDARPDERNLSDINTFFAGQYSKVSVRRGSCRNKVFAEKAGKRGKRGTARRRLTPPDRQGLAFDFGFAHHFQFFRDVAALFGQLGIFDDVIINAIFVIALHAGDDALDGFHAHARFDVVAEVVQQQNALLVITDLFLNVLNFTLQFVLTTVQTNKLQYVPKEGLVVSIFTPLIIEIRIRKATAL